LLVEPIACLIISYALLVYLTFVLLGIIFFWWEEKILFLSHGEAAPFDFLPEENSELLRKS